MNNIEDNRYYVSEHKGAVKRNDTKMVLLYMHGSLACQPLHLAEEGLASLVQCFRAGSDFCDPPVRPIRLQNTCKL